MKVKNYPYYVMHDSVDRLFHLMLHPEVKESFRDVHFYYVLTTFAVLPIGVTPQCVGLASMFSDVTKSGYTTFFIAMIAVFLLFATLFVYNANESKLLTIKSGLAVIFTNILIASSLVLISLAYKTVVNEKETYRVLPNIFITFDVYICLFWWFIFYKGEVHFFTLVNYGGIKFLNTPLEQGRRIDHKILYMFNRPPQPLYLSVILDNSIF